MRDIKINCLKPTIFLALLLILFVAQMSYAASLNLAWYPNQEEDLGGYKIYYGTSSRDYGFPVDAGNNTAYELPGLDEGETYYIALTAYDIFQNESDKSDEENVFIEITEICTDGIDNDEDGYTDCEDQSCAFDPVCEGEEPFEIVIEAEDMSNHDNGVQVGEFWNLWANGLMSEDVYFPDTDTYRFEIIAKGDLASDVDPEMGLLIDGEIIDTVFVDNGPETFTFDVEVSAGTHELGIGSYNDLCPQESGSNIPTVYEDAEDGTTDRWYVYDDTPEGAEIINVFDEDRQSNVIQFSGSGWDNGYRLTRSGGGNWHNSDQLVIEWSMKYTEFFMVYIDIETTEGHRYLTYTPDDYSSLGDGEYVIYGLGAGAMDGQWHTYVRDLQADLEGAQPGVTITEVNGFLIRGSGRVDDIKLFYDIPSYEDAEDGTTDRWYVYDDTPDGAEIVNVFDEDRQSQVIQFSGSGWDNGYRLTRSGGGNWHNSDQLVIEWSMKYTEFFMVYIDIETTEGHRYLTYTPDDYSSLGDGEYVIYGLGAGAMDGQWHTYVRDLQADLEGAQPGVTITEVNGFLIRGSGMVDDIRLHTYYTESICRNLYVDKIVLSNEPDLLFQEFYSYLVNLYMLFYFLFQIG